MTKFRQNSGVINYELRLAGLVNKLLLEVSTK